MTPSYGGEHMEISRRNFIKKSLRWAGIASFPMALAYGQPKKTEEWRPAYEKLEREGKFTTKIKLAYSIFQECRLCPRQCGVNRVKGERGFCQAPVKCMVYSFHPHFGEEVPPRRRKWFGHNFLL